MVIGEWIHLIQNYLQRFSYSNSIFRMADPVGRGHFRCLCFI